MQNTQNTTTSTPHSDRLNRIRYRSWHRGCKETDIVLGNFCNAFIEEMDAAQLDLFELFLEEDDADIWAWLTEKYSCETTSYHPMLAQMRTFRSYSPIK